MVKPRRKKAATPAFEKGREFKLRLPPDVSAWVEQRAADTGHPQSRVVIDSLASLDHLETLRDFNEAVGDMRVMLARYGARITMADLSDDLLRAVDAVLAAKTDGELQARLDKLRVLRIEMLKFEKTAKE
jgi:hypothetical protein